MKAMIYLKNSYIAFLLIALVGMIGCSDYLMLYR